MRAPQGLCIHPQEDSALRAHSPRGNKIGFIRRIKQNQRKAAFSAESSESNANASPKSTSLLPPKPRASTLRLITCIDFCRCRKRHNALPRGKVLPAQGCRCRKKDPIPVCFQYRTESCRTWLPSPCRESGACFCPPVHRIACREPNLQ